MLSKVPISPPEPAAELQSRIHETWDRLADFDAIRTEEARLFLMEESKNLVHADDAVWVGVVRMAHGKSAERDHQLGWRGRVVVHL